MDEVDGTLIRQLREIDCHFDEDKRTLRELDSGEIVSCMLRCLSLILPDQDVPADPGANVNMATKYNVASYVAIKCKELGFRGDLGYQSFMYGSESDIRNVMLFLIEKLPKESASVIPVRTDVTMSDRFTASPELNRKWVPPVPHACDREEMVAIPISGILNAKSILANRIAPNKRQYYDKYARIPFHDVYSISQSHLVHQQSPLSASSIKYSISLLPITSPMQTMPMHSEITMKTETMTQQADQHEENYDTESKQTTGSRTRLELLEEELREKSEAAESCRHAISRMRERIVGLETSLRDEQVRLLELKSRNLSLQELREVEQKAQQDLQDLKRKWQEVRHQLEQEIRELTASSSKSEEYQHLISETKKQIRNKRKEIESKSETLDHVKSLLPAQMPPTRNSYTKRILEIINNIKKQDAETRKLISETRGLQKEITLLTGKVSRCFFLADEAIFSQAKTDDFSRKSYKLLASMHQESNQLSRLIESTGLLRREILKLEESVQKETAMDIETKLAKISDDYLQLKQSNNQMMLQLQNSIGEQE